jgi:ribose transport system substrate-binding protein
LDPEAYEHVINQGMALGKPIIVFDSDAPESNCLVHVGADNYARGLEWAKLLKQVKSDGREYGMVSGFGLNLAE